jgi:tetratricopeptide (TPR) repeat protein/tRNA A-37 threonylcarbamoyl transferase component Bud32
MGVVFKARQPALDREVAVKLLRDAHAADSGQRERFMQEARAVARLRHPHLVQLYEFGEVDGADGATSQPYLVLEYVAGGNLADLLRGTPQPPPEAAQLMETLADAIHYAHTQGVIHRDLKPANVLLSFRPEAPTGVPTGGARLNDTIPKITDFGLAKFLTGSDLTRTGDVLGTPSYMAPEQTMGKSGAITAAVDVYGLGAILYEALTGRPPFQAETAVATLGLVQQEEPVPPRRLQPTVPGDLETICLKCLRKEASRRYGTAQELADDLRRFRAGEPIRARPVGRTERVLRWCRRRPLVASLLAALMLALAGGATGVVWQWQRAEAKAAEARQARELAEAIYAKIRETIDRMAEHGEAISYKLEGQALLQEALATYQVLLQEMGDEPTVNLRKAQAQLRIAEIRFWLRERHQATKVNRRARDLLKRLDASDRAVRRLLARSHALEGNMLASEWYTRKLADAANAYRRAIELQVPLYAAEPHNADLRTKLLDSLLYLAYVLSEQGRSPEAKPIHKRTLALLEPLFDAAPKDPRYLQRMAHHLSNLGRARRASSRPDEAEKLFARALDLCRQWHAVEPDKPHARSWQSGFLIDLAHLAWGSAGRRGEAEHKFRQAIKLRKQLAEEFGHVPRYRQHLAWSLWDLSNLLRGSGRYAEARETAREGVVVAAKVVARWPTYPDARWMLAVNHCSAALALEKLGKPEEALTAFRVAVAEFEKLAEQDPKEVNYRENAAWRSYYVGRLARAAGQNGKAARAWRRTVELWEHLASEFPLQAAYVRSQVPVTFALGQLHMANKNYAAAQEAYRKTLALNDRLVTQFKGGPGDRFNKAWDLSHLSEAYEAAGQLAEAREYLKQSIKEFRRLADDFPKDLRYRNDLRSRRAELKRLLLKPRR